MVLAPHTDDGELGCGASIARAIREGAEVYYIALSTAEESIPSDYPSDQLKKEVKLATAALGIPTKNLILFDYKVRKLNYVRQEILESLVELNKKLNPDIVFLPAQNDIHQDHSTVANEGIRAFKQCSILSYELIWNNLSFHTSSFIRVSAEDVELKLMALTKYETQRGRNYMDPDFIRSLAKVRGTQIGVEYAEAFQVIRWII